MASPAGRAFAFAAALIGLAWARVRLRPRHAVPARRRLRPLAAVRRCPDPASPIVGWIVREDLPP